MQTWLAILITLFFVAICGYLISIMREKYDLMRQQVVIKSKVVTQKIIDEIDLKIFKLGRNKLIMGDEIRLRLKDNNILRGIVLGAKKTDNVLCLVTLQDEIVEVSVTKIQKLTYVTKYGRIF